MVEEKESIVALATALATVRNHSGDSFARIYEALTEIEQLIFRHKDSCGIENVQFQQGCEEFLLLCNTAAIHHLKLASASAIELGQCGELLTRAEQHTRRSGYLRSVADRQHTTNRIHLRLVCLNNLACYNKQMERPLLAIGFLEKALEIQLRQQDSQQKQQGVDEGDNAIALTHLNLCAVLSQMHRHDAAAQHARSATDLLLSMQQATESDVNMLVVAYYNLAVECEHLRDLKQAIAASEQGLVVARQHGLDRDSHEAVGLLEQMCCLLQQSDRARAIKSPRSLLSPRRARLGPPSPRTLRQKS